MSFNRAHKAADKYVPETVRTHNGTIPERNIHHGMCRFSGETPEAFRIENETRTISNKNTARGITGLSGESHSSLPDNPTYTYNYIVQLKEKYYEDSGKNVIFKNGQKFSCAKNICSKINVIELMNHTFWVVPNKNQFYFDYRIYKLYGHPDDFKLVVENILHMTRWCIAEYGSFEIHVNLLSFSVSAAERYKMLICMFCEMCANQTDVSYLTNLSVMKLYNIPTVFEHISNLLLPILPPEVVPKICLVKKEDSDSLLNQIYCDSGKIYTP
jgi:hypothetical protein